MMDYVNPKHVYILYMYIYIYTLHCNHIILYLLRHHFIPLEEPLHYSQLQLSLELRNCFPYVRTYDATNLGQFLSDHFHIAYMVLSTITVSVFIEKCF